MPPLTRPLLADPAMNKKNRNALPLAAVWLFVLTLLLILPGSSFPHENWMSKISLDKWVHIFLFSVLVLLWVTGLGRRSPDKFAFRKMAVIVCLAAIVYGIMMEFVQKYWVPNRSFELLDILADTGGSLAGYFIAMGRYIKK